MGHGDKTVTNEQGATVTNEQGAAQDVRHAITDRINQLRSEASELEALLGQIPTDLNPIASMGLFRLLIRSR